jgi:hypothetical protein
MSDHAKELAMQAWFVARGANGAGQFIGDVEFEVKCRDDFERWWRDPHGYYADPATGHAALVRRVRELEAGLRAACRCNEPDVNPPTDWKSKARIPHHTDCPMFPFEPPDEKIAPAAFTESQAALRSLLTKDTP